MTRASWTSAVGATQPWPTAAPCRASGPDPAMTWSPASERSTPRTSCLSWPSSPASGREPAGWPLTEGPGGDGHAHRDQDDAAQLIAALARPAAEPCAQLKARQRQDDAHRADDHGPDEDRYLVGTEGEPHHQVVEAEGQGAEQQARQAAVPGGAVPGGAVPGGAMPGGAVARGPAGGTVTGGVAGTAVPGIGVAGVARGGIHRLGHCHAGGSPGADGADDSVEANADQQGAADPVARPAKLCGDVVADEQADDGHP